MPETFPEVQGGGSLILAWQIKGKNVLVVGGGEVCLNLSNTSATDLCDNELTCLPGRCWPDPKSSQRRRHSLRRLPTFRSESRSSSSRQKWRGPAHRPGFPAS
jgi:hypothetical protein